MARLSGGKLTNLRCTTAGAGMHADGNGLYLQVRLGSNGLTRSWVYRYSTAGKETWMGLGPFPLISLAAAREKATDARRLRLDGNDPLAQRRNQRASLRREGVKQAIPTFDECRDQYVASHSQGWRSVVHTNEWTRWLTAYVTPVFGSTPVDMIDTALVSKALEPLWHTKVNTASRVRGRIENVLDWAKVRGYRAGENPARWRGHLENLLPTRSKVRRVVHYRALPYSQLPKFMEELRKIEGMTARCLEFVVLTAARSNEVLTAKWSEMDLQARTWALPASRMKGGHEHRVPLAPAAVAVLEALPRNGEYVFTGHRGRQYLSPASTKMLLIRMKQPTTTHGFRSSFRDWCAERTNYPSELAEMALAHRVGNAVENAYRRTDMFERRRRLMADWANFCDGKSISAEVVLLRA
jgi:integrase